MVNVPKFMIEILFLFVLSKILIKSLFCIVRLIINLFDDKSFYHALNTWLPYIVIAYKGLSYAN